MDSALAAEEEIPMRRDGTYLDFHQQGLFTVHVCEPSVQLMNILGLFLNIWKIFSEYSLILDLRFDESLCIINIAKLSGIFITSVAGSKSTRSRFAAVSSFSILTIFRK